MEIKTTNKEKRAWFVNPFAGIKMRIHDFFHRHEIYVEIDPRDNSVTMSRGFVSAAVVLHMEDDKVLVLCEKDDDKKFLFTFDVGADVNEDETQVGHVQYNSKFSSFGFETLCPSVNWMYYKWGIRDMKMRKLKVTRHVIHGKDYWYIETPSA